MAQKKDKHLLLFFIIGAVIGFVIALLTHF